MNIYLSQPRRQTRAAMSSRRRRNRRHDVLIMLLLGVLAVVAALAWLAEHLAVLAGVALLIGGAYYLGSFTAGGRHDPVRPGSRYGRPSPQPPRRCQRPRCRRLTTTGMS